MIEELGLLNYWLLSKDPFFLHKQGIDVTYFFALRDVADWVDEFHHSNKALPSIETTAVQFEHFRKVADLDPIEYLVGTVKEQKAYAEYRPVLIQNSQLVNAGKTVEAMQKMRVDIDGLLRKYTANTSYCDWVGDAEKRFAQYMERHGQTGLSGLTTGIKGLDALTGGWRKDDLILLAGRTSEGKSMLGCYFAFKAWKSLQQARINSPVIYITTEMPETEIGYRLDTLHAQFPNRSLNEGRLDNPTHYKEYLSELAKKDGKLIILSQEANGRRAFTPTDIRAIVESERPAFMIIDQLYDLTDGSGERDIRKRIVNISTQIREVNLSTLTPIMLVAQASRNAAKEAKRDPNVTPDIFDIQESDNPAQKATRVITLRLINDVFKLSLKKNRGGARDVDVFMRVDIDKGIWCEVAPEETVF